MRDLIECQAEVFRRSEKRIKARRQRRKHIAIACVPLVLCVILATPLLWPKEKTAAPGGNETAMGGVQENIGESLICSIAKITVTGTNASKAFTAPADVLPIWDLLASCKTKAPQASGGETKAPESAGRNTETADPKYAITAGPQYTITLVMHDGEKCEYRLTGNILENLTADQTHTLSQKEVQELYALLGIPGR